MIQSFLCIAYTDVDKADKAPAISAFTTSLWLSNAGQENAPAFSAFITSM